MSTWRIPGVVGIAVLVMVWASAILRADCEPVFRRADSNADGKLDLSDGIATLGFLFLGNIALPCLDAADANDSGGLDLTDAVFSFLYLFASGNPPPMPGPADCGVDPTADELGCASGAPCPSPEPRKEVCDGLDNDCDGVVDCPDGFYCRTEPGGCGEIAACAEKPIGCPKILQPVCGCNGVTYDNDCLAAADGVSVAHEGECSTGPCDTNEECAANAYCLKAAGDCSGEGVCTARPQVCPDNVDPVCGCNGVTYGNECEAAASGRSIASRGPCPVIQCTSNEECLGFCAKAIGDCEGIGECQPRAEACPLFFKPVCGCDNMTYGNSCEAAAAGVSVLHEGPCGMPRCESGDDCEPDFYCDKTPGDCIGSGTCTAVPSECPDEDDPVCGCDGVTYPNACFAALAAQSVAHPGECEPE